MPVPRVSLRRGVAQAEMRGRSDGKGHVFSDEISPVCNPEPLIDLGSSLSRRVKRSVLVRFDCRRGASLV